MSNSFSLTIDCDNDAFVGNKHAEIARILREVAAKIEAGKYVTKLRDINGNTVGSVEFNA